MQKSQEPPRKVVGGIGVLLLNSRWCVLNMEFVNIEDALRDKQKYFFVGKEKEYEQYVADNLEGICAFMNLPKIKSIERQKRYNLDGFSIIVDILAIHEDDTYSVFEVKCGNSKYPSSSASEQTRAIGQLLLYKSVLRKINNASPRMFLVDQKIHFRTMCVFSEIKLPITLIEVQNDRVFIPYALHQE